MIELLDRLQERADTTTVITDLYNDVRFSSDGLKVLEVGGDEWVLTDDAFVNLMNDVGVPKKYAERCPASLLDQNVNFWLSRRQSDEMLTGLVTNGKIRAFVPKDYTYVPTIDIVKTILESEHIKGDYEFQNVSLTDTDVRFTLLTDRESGGNLGDISRSGLQAVLSDSWSVAPKLETLLLRLVCTNGMTCPIHGRKFRISGQETEQILTQVEDFVGSAFEQIDALIFGYEALRQQHVDNVETLLKRIVKENRMPMTVFAELLAAMNNPSFQQTMPESELSTMFDVVNVLTWVSTHNGEIADSHRQKLSHIASTISLTGSTRCNHCGSAV